MLSATGRPEFRPIQATGRPEFRPIQATGRPEFRLLCQRFKSRVVQFNVTLCQESAETVRTIRHWEHRTATSTFAQLLRSLLRVSIVYNFILVPHVQINRTIILQENTQLYNPVCNRSHTFVVPLSDERLKAVRLSQSLQMKATNFDGESRGSD